MQQENRFFGWANYLTCLAATWLHDEVDFERSWFQRAGTLLRVNPRSEVQTMLEDDLQRHIAAHSDSMSGMFRQLRFPEFLGQVNWSEIAELMMRDWDNEYE